MLFSQQKGCLRIDEEAEDKRLFEKEHAAASPLIRGSDAGCNVCAFECSGVCWLTGQIRPSYRGSGYLSHSQLMASSCMCQSDSTVQLDWFVCQALRWKKDIQAHQPAFAAEGHVKLWSSSVWRYNIICWIVFRSTIYKISKIPPHINEVQRRTWSCGFSDLFCHIAQCWFWVSSEKLDEGTR